jgi:hypothetical protein
MGLREFFKVKRKASASRPEQHLHLQVLLSSEVLLSADMLMGLLRECHPCFAQVRAQVMTGRLGPREGLFGQLARVQWDRHAVKVAFLGVPVPTDMMEQIGTFALYAEDLRTRARGHTAHAILVYEGEEQDPLEQYRVLAKIAVALLPLGALAVVNPDACSAYPADLLRPRPGEELDEVLNTLPLMALFVGFVRATVEGRPGVWVRTCGAPLLGLPDLAMNVKDPRECARVYLIFKNIFEAMRSTGVRFGVGDLVQDEETHWKFRAPHRNEGFLDSPRMIVLEPTEPTVRLP